MKKKGRPSIRTPELEERIFDLIADGLSLRRLCRRDDMPNRKTIRRWRQADPDFDHRLRVAEEERMHFLGDELLEFIDTVTDPTLRSPTCPPGGPPDRVDNARVQALRVKAENYRWFMERVAPKDFAPPGTTLRLQVERPTELRANFQSWMGKADVSQASPSARQLPEESVGEDDS